MIPNNDRYKEDYNKRSSECDNKSYTDKHYYLDPINFCSNFAYIDLSG